MISFEKENIKIYYFGKERPNGKKSSQRKIVSVVWMSVGLHFKQCLAGSLFFTRLVEFGSRAFIFRLEDLPLLAIEHFQK